MNNLEHINNDFSNGASLFEKLEGNFVTIYGSARVKPEDKFYKDAYTIANELAKKNFNIITGGSNGIMEASNKGAFEAKNDNIKSIGLGIKLPFEQSMNKYLNVGIEFHHFFSRKFYLANNSKHFVIFPGGFGTLDELSEILVFSQTKILPDLKIFLYDSEFWNPLKEFLEKSLLKNNMIKQEDLNLFVITDNIQDIISDIN